MNYKAFRDTVWDFYKKSKREFPWRKTHDPYAILISEIMLQQTQTDRVVPKYQNWLKKFPNFESLASAKLKNVIKEWQGLGYNRRALALKRLAEVVIKNHDGKLPETYEELLNLPGIGPYTAGAILAFAHNKPVAMLETNIRTVYIHHFFSENKKTIKIHDKGILKLVEKTLPREALAKWGPREWFWALMDYGAYIKKNFGNLNVKSKHYTRQSKFIGSNRQIRSGILKRITKSTATSSQIEDYLKKEKINIDSDLVFKNILVLEKEGFIINRKSKYSIA
jgi:A/G-specific adenine glycosylase